MDSLIHAGIKRVVVSALDPNPLVSTRGKAALDEVGIKTKLGEHEEEARELYEAYIKFITTGLPFVNVKFAMSLDGKIATKTGDSRWISGEGSREYVHQLRRAADVIMVGVNTVLSDDPQLTARDSSGLEKQPLRVIVDGEARTPLTARLFSEPGTIIVATTPAAARNRVKKLEKAGAEVLEFSPREGLVNLDELIRELGARELTSVLVEGGGTLLGSFFEQGLVDKVIVFIAPLIIGGKEAKLAVGGKGAERIAQALRLSRVKVERFGDDVMIVGYVGC